MTKVMTKETDTEIEYIIEGHARKVNEGEGNILCAAISILGQTLAEALMGIEDAESHIQISDGKVKATSRKTEKNKDHLKMIYRVIDAGFKLLESRYPDEFERIGHMGDS